MGLESESLLSEVCESRKTVTSSVCSISDVVENDTINNAVEHGSYNADNTPPCKRSHFPGRDKAKRTSSVRFRDASRGQCPSPPADTETEASFEAIDSNGLTDNEHGSPWKGVFYSPMDLKTGKNVVISKKSSRIASEHDAYNTLQPRKLFVERSSDIKRRLAVSALNRSYEIDDDLSGYGEEDVLSPDRPKGRQNCVPGVEHRGLPTLEKKFEGKRPCSLATEEDMDDFEKAADMETPAVRPKDRPPLMNEKRLVRRNAFCESECYKQDSIDELSLVSVHSDSPRAHDKSSNGKDSETNFVSAFACARKLDFSIDSISNSDNNFGLSLDQESQGATNYQDQFLDEKSLLNSKWFGDANECSELEPSYESSPLKEKRFAEKSKWSWLDWGEVPEFIKAEIEKQRNSEPDQNNNKSTELVLYKNEDELCPIETEKNKEVNKKVVKDFLNQSLKQQYESKNEWNLSEAFFIKNKIGDDKRRKSLNVVFNSYSKIMIQRGTDKESLTHWLEQSLIVFCGFRQEEVAEFRQKVEAHFSDAYKTEYENRLRKSYDEFIQNRRLSNGSVFVFPEVGAQSETSDKEVTLFCFACNEHKSTESAMVPRMPFCNKYCNVCRDCMLNEVRDRAKMYLFNRVPFSVQCLICNQPMVDQLLGKDAGANEGCMTNLYKEWLLTNIVPYVTDLDERRVILDFISLFSF